MKATVKVPDALFHKAKAVAALRGCKFQDLVEEGLSHVLDTPEPAAIAANSVPSVHELMRKYCGIVASEVLDLASNPEHMEAFGRAATGNR